MSTRKKILLALIAGMVVLLLALSFRPQPVPVTTAPVVTGPLAVTVLEEARTRVRDRYVISAPVAGQVPRLDLEVGDTVQAGQVLLTIGPAPSTPLDPRTRAQAEARVEEAEAAYRLAEEELRRARILFERGDIPRSTLDQAEASAGQARAALQSARAALTFGPEPAERVEVTAPVGGRVLAIENKSQRVVQAGEPLLAIGDPNRIEVEADVLSVDAVRIEPGMRVLFERWGGEPLEGRVRTIEPAGFTRFSALGVEEQRVLVIADFVSPPPQWQRLGDAYRVEARFILWAEDEVLQVPTSALFRRNGQWAAFVVERDEARLRSVSVGRQSGLESQILEGLAEGETVITHPDDAIADGVRVAPR